MSPGGDRQAVAGLERAVRARTDGDLHDFVVGRERHRLDHIAAGDERRRARDDVEGLGDLRVRNGADRRTGLGRPAPQDADREVVLAEVDHLHLPIDASPLRAFVLQDGGDVGLADGGDRRRLLRGCRDR